MSSVVELYRHKYAAVRRRMLRIMKLMLILIDDDDVNELVHVDFIYSFALSESPFDDE